MENLRDCFDLLMTLPQPQRSEWLAEHVPDADRRSMLRRMLAEAELGTPAGDRADSDLAERLHRLAPHQDDAVAATWIGRRVGAFKLIRLIGQGGMGAIFLAHREDADFAQQVAVKLLRRGLFSELELRLFRRERQALASLSHANIARLIDGGVTESGTPYLAMEFVDGVAINCYCTDHRLGLRRRLELLLAVCRGVQHAHGLLIVHRDIKPSNILVNSEGMPKLLDFGVAKLLEGEDGETQTGIAAMTPEYAAPEQFCGGLITAATDVFSLGILMHELLLGERPHQSPPRRPSSRVTELSPNNVALPANAVILRGLLRGDLDNIMLKALDPEPHRRYSSAGPLGDDIECYLQGMPVAAHPPSRWYRTRKFAQRHRGGIAAATVLVAALFITFVHSLWQTRVAREQTQRAEQELARATATTDFMLGMFEGVAPSGPSAMAPTVADLLTSGAESLRNDQRLDNDSRDMLLVKLASVQRRWGRIDDAAHSAGQVAVSRTAASHPPDRIALLAAEQWMLARHAVQDYEEVNRIYARFASDSERAAPDLAAVLLAISSNADGGQMRSKALEKARRAVTLCDISCTPADRIRVRRNLADILDDIDPSAGHAKTDLTEAEHILRNLLRDAPAIDGPNHPNVADDHFELSYILRKLARLDEAEQYAESGIQRIRAVYNRPHPRMVTHYLNAGKIATAQGQFAKAIDFYRQALDIHVTQLSPDTSFLPAIIIGLAEAELASGSESTALVHLQRLRGFLVSKPGEQDSRIRQIDALIVAQQNAGKR